MKTEKAALFLYLTASLLAVIATMFEYELLILITRPIVVPSILFYYLSIKNSKANPFFVSVLLLNFIGDTIILLDLENSTLIIMVPYFLSYLLMIKFAISDMLKIRFNRKGFIVGGVIFGFLMYLLYVLIQLFMDTSEELVVPVIVYGFILAGYLCMASYGYYSDSTMTMLFLLLTALSGSLSDIFYVLFTLIFHFPGFYYFEFAIQLVSYFFMVKYFVLRENRQSVLVVT
ncbi:hypothetical protein [Flavobacterium sp. GT3R68]|uniref:hypothetical protein n=1 Tax=Flavobacterium sp. GT3R68 TaxID=2594437 RepID=UPI000F8741FB|nr:hypothetical protein [Flavobacterium sp. GT3R68]RTY95102.1 hypothetical protein EKL32_09295 [Flavobacterium sp. GSN2]TRW91908.1 hypothetical protein FNW07_08470 [Flavobacterium sp. GT3R68]